MTATLILAVAALMFRMSGSEMKVGGVSMYRLISGSMAPKYKTGDYVLVRDTDPTTLAVGEIIAFVSDAPDTVGEVIVHRIVEIKDDGEIITRGDANPIDDKTATDASRVIGRVVMKISILRYADGVLSNAAMFLLFIVFPVAFMIYNEVALMLSRARELRRLKALVVSYGLDPNDEALLELAGKYGEDAVRSVALSRGGGDGSNSNQGDDTK